MFSRDEADITMISYVIEAGNVGKAVIHILNDDQTCMGHYSLLDVLGGAGVQDADGAVS